MFCVQNTEVKPMICRGKKKFAFPRFSLIEKRKSKSARRPANLSVKLKNDISKSHRGREREALISGLNITFTIDNKIS